MTPSFTASLKVKAALCVGIFFFHSYTHSPPIGVIVMPSLLNASPLNQRTSRATVCASFSSSSCLFRLKSFSVKFNKHSPSTLCERSTVLGHKHSIELVGPGESCIGLQMVTVTGEMLWHLSSTFPVYRFLLI